MVMFNEHSFTVTVETKSNPIENWLATHSEMVDALQSEDDNMHEKRFHYLELLRALMPDWETAKRMSVNHNELRKQ